MKDGARLSLRVGSVCAIFGTVMYALFGALHGSLSGRRGAEALFRHVQERPYWDLINLGSLLCILFWLAAFITLARSIARQEFSRNFAMLAAACLTFGASIASLQFLVDGFTLTALANEWSAASPSDQRDIVQTGDLLQTLIREPVFASEPIFLFGLPFALMGFSVVLDRRFPIWLGVSGALVGAATFIMGVTWFAGSDLIPEIALWAVLQPLEWIWLICLGILMWRLSSSLS